MLSQGNAPVIRCGICWSTNPNPTINDDTTIGDMATGFFGELDNFTVNTTYYARAYATNSYGTGYGDTLSFTTAYWIGEIFGGGKIFYVDNTNVHGLIVAPQTNFGGTWYNGSIVWTYAWSEDDGAANTADIIQVQGSGTYAAIMCQNYFGGGYTDWFLPSIRQLDLLYAVKDKIRDLDTYDYWSSTEDKGNVINAWSINMASGITTSDFKTISYYHIIPVRAF